MKSNALPEEIEYQRFDTICHILHTYDATTVFYKKALLNTENVKWTKASGETTIKKAICFYPSKSPRTYHNEGNISYQINFKELLDVIELTHDLYFIDVKKTDKKSLTRIMFTDSLHSMHDDSVHRIRPKIEGHPIWQDKNGNYNFASVLNSLENQVKILVEITNEEKACISGLLYSIATRLPVDHSQANLVNSRCYFSIINDNCSDALTVDKTTKKINQCLASFWTDSSLNETLPSDPSDSNENIPMTSINVETGEVVRRSTLEVEIKENHFKQPKSGDDDTASRLQKCRRNLIIGSTVCLITGIFITIGFMLSKKL